MGVTCLRKQNNSNWLFQHTIFCIGKKINMPQHEFHNVSPYINRIPMYGELNWHSIICENSCGRIRRVLLKMQSPHFARWRKQPQEKPLINTFSLQRKLPQNHFYSCRLQLMGCLNSLCENCLWLPFCVSTVLMHSHSTHNEFSQSEMCPSKLILLFMSIYFQLYTWEGTWPSLTTDMYFQLHL